MSPQNRIPEYFLGVGFPPEENEFFTELKAMFHPEGIVTSPPHITLKPPFYWQDMPGLIARLDKWAKKQDPFEVTLAPVGSFRQRKYGTVFLVPEKGEDLKRLERSISQAIPPLKDQDNFIPHLTVGNRVPLDELQEMKQKVREMRVSLETTVKSVVLFRHYRREPWEKFQEFFFRKHQI